MKRPQLQGPRRTTRHPAQDTARPVPSVAAPPGPRVSRPPPWRVAWATSGSPPRT
ncbi:hypothetical protein [Streptomyces echinatus]|uniref:hypothetical protein n=1 Tax=Streptomyces echinatus TaxID=67293 RepID=UPI003CD0638A